MKALAARRMRRSFSVFLLVVLLAGSLPSKVVTAQGRQSAASQTDRATTTQAAPRQVARAAAPTAPRESCYSTDLDCDHDVDEADVKLVAGHWNCASGSACYDTAYDLDRNGIIDAFDMAWVSNDYDTAAPSITVTSPTEGQVVGLSAITVHGTIIDAHDVVSATVNGVPAALNGKNFSASMSLPSGNQVLKVLARDVLGRDAQASRVVGVDGEGPQIAINEPKHRQSVYTLQPTIAISYTDFYSASNLDSLHVQLSDAAGPVRDVTGDLAVGTQGAFGTLSTPLSSDHTYTLTVTIQDTFGNPGIANGNFYVPADHVTPPEQPPQAGWIVGTVYDSSTCDQGLQNCRGLPGVRLWVSQVNTPILQIVREARHAQVLAAIKDGQSVAPMDASTTSIFRAPISGTIISGPDGFFAFPLAITGAYWLLADKEGYTYAQREATVVHDRSTSTNAIYLTPIDPNITTCSSTGCSHVSSDGLVQVTIPARAIPPGEVVTTTATNFQHADYLPSGELPPGTKETYAFNLGGDSHINFSQPITVKERNTRGFAPGTRIPLGYWNPLTQAWEHAGVGTVESTGQWVMATTTHFSNYDLNFPTAGGPGGGASGGSSGGGCDGVCCSGGGFGGSAGGGSGGGGCGAGGFCTAASTGGCAINLRSGAVDESIELAGVDAGGSEGSPLPTLQQPSGPCYNGYRSPFDTKS